MNFIRLFRGSKTGDALKALYQWGRQISRYRIQRVFGALYPNVINFPVTDRCNSRCVMCNVWKEENVTDLATEAIAGILSDPLFKKVRSVGLSGGEPTLRNDLAQLGQVMIRKLPKLKGLSIISNGLQPEKVENSIKALAQVCQQHRKTLSVMISIDGIGDVHDQVRGVPKAFVRMQETIERLQKMPAISLALCCTIMRQNVDELNRIWNFAKARGLYIKFRVATRVDRLYNFDCTGGYTLNETQRHCAAQFLEKLAMTYEQDWERKLYYVSLRDMLVENKPRTVPCLWERDGVTLDAKGKIYYCAVKSKSLGNALEISAKKLYFQSANLEYRGSIKKTACAACSHDYTTLFTRRLLFQLLKTTYRKIILLPLLDRGMVFFAELLRLVLLEKKPRNKKLLKKLFVMGWYGTETTGDKAILTGILQNIQQDFGEVDTTIASYHPFYTRRTVSEIGNVKIKIVSIGTASCSRALHQSDLIVMGGGPLMEIRDVVDVLRFVLKGRLQRKITMLYGIGVGPLYSKRLKRVVKLIVQLADIVTVRDQRSMDCLQAMGAAKGVELSIDPSTVYLLGHPGRHLRKTEKIKKIGFSIRAWPRNYAATLSEEVFKEKLMMLVQVYAEVIEYLVKTQHAEVTLVPMNTFYVGDDDRDILEQIQAALPDEVKTRIVTGTGAPSEIAGEIAAQDLFIGMRFHSVVFAATLGVPVIALDYTHGKGKVSGFMEMMDQAEAVIDINDLTKEMMLEKIAGFSKKINVIGEQLMCMQSVLLDKNDINRHQLQLWFAAKKSGV
ncbi:polysaccharide pyruvyl transferase family protein [bacterium]|nr:polysaccharide pyruvyl transferase family protein [bacterium]